MLAEKYILLDSLLCKIINAPETTIIGYTRRLHGQNNYTISFKSIYGTSMSYKTISYY